MRPAAEAAIEALSAPAGVVTPFDVSKRRVLVVEDSHDFADVVVEAVRALGHEPLVEYEVAAARHRLTRAPDAVDILITDIAFPDGGSGLELAACVRHLHESVEGCSVRTLIALSGFDDDEHRQARASSAASVRHDARSHGGRCMRGSARHGEG